MEIYDFNPNHEGFHGAIDPVSDAVFDVRLRTMDHVLYFNAALHAGFDVIFDNKVPVLTAAQAISETARHKGIPIGHVRGVIAETAQFVNTRMLTKQLRTQAPPASPFDVFTMEETDVPKSLAEHLETLGGSLLMLVNSFEVLEYNASNTADKDHYRSWKSLAFDVLTEIDRNGRAQ